MVANYCCDRANSKQTLNMSGGFRGVTFYRFCLHFWQAGQRCHGRSSEKGQLARISVGASPQRAEDGA